MNPRVFVNYRREDTRHAAGRLYDRLIQRFGENQVFIDVDQIVGGDDFVDVINDRVGTCDVAIVVIGPRWLDASDRLGKRRIDDEEDFVRMEIVAALQRNIRVIPVLVDGARMPGRHDLPEALAPLSRRNAIELSETRFHADVNRLIKAIEKSVTVAEKEAEPSATPVASLPSESTKPAERIFKKIKQHAIVGFIIVISTIIIAVGNFFGALSKIREFWKPTEVKRTTVAELENAVRATSIELKQEFDSVTVGRAPPIPEPDFRRVRELIAKIERLDHGNGHVIYYTAFVKRWRDQRPASHDGLFWYLERAKDPNLFLPGDNGDAKFCFDNWLGFCKQRQGYINHTLAIDFQHAATETKDPAVALNRLKAALDYAKAAIAVYGDFTDPGQGPPTKVLVERLQTQVSDTEKALKGTVRK